MTAAGDLRSAAGELAEFPDAAVRRAVTTLRGVVLPVARVDTGGDLELSGVGGKLTVTTKVSGTAFVEGVVQAGPVRRRAQWRWLEAGTRARVTSTGRTHPGTKGKRTWSDPVERALPDVERQIVSDFERLTL